MSKKHNNIPILGATSEEVLRQVTEKKKKDIAWNTGKIFGFVYYPGEEAARMAEEIYRLYLHENPLNPAIFPSIRSFENEVVSMTAGLLHALPGFGGNVTSGGTESIFLAMKAAKRYAENKKQLKTNHEIILPSTAHPAFRKASEILDLRVKTIPVLSNKRADISAMADAINENTILLAGSAPTFPHGVVDPIMEIGELALKHDLLFHVDACIGGFMLPFLEILGYPVPPFDFRIPGVTSISADAHKFGYGPKGTSVILYRDKKIRRLQFFTESDWPGGIFGTAGFLGTRNGASVVATWALFQMLGMNGYLERAKKSMETALTLQREINLTGGLHVIGKPDMSVFAFTSDCLNIYHVGDELDKRGWHLSRLQFPAALHMNVTHFNQEQALPFLEDLREVVGNLQKKRTGSGGSRWKEKLAGRISDLLPEKIFRKISASAGKSMNKNLSNADQETAFLYGMASAIKKRENMKEILLDLLDEMYS